MAAAPNEAKLVSLAQQGSKEAFGTLYERYLTAVYRYVFYRLGNQQDAEDLTETIFLKAWEHLPRFQGEVPFKSWIYRIAGNAVIDQYRTRKEVAILPENFEMSGPVDDIERQLIQQEQSHRLAAALKRLDPLHQDVLVLRFISGFSTRETAELLEKEAGAVRVLQHRALKALRTVFLLEEL